MSMQRAFSAVFIGGLVLTLLTVSRAQVDSRRIDEVLAKSVLTQEDFAIIDAFVDTAVGRLVRTIDFTDVATTRAQILNRRGTQAQYAERFAEALERELAEGFQYARTEIGDARRRFKVFTNLLILINELSDPRLIDLAIQMIPHENSAVRYWAMRAATNPAAWAKLNQDRTAAGQTAGRIVEASGNVVESSSPEVLHLMAQFAGQRNTEAARQLLARVADARIRRYADWDVEYELVDTAILRLLCDRITAGGTANPELAKRFAQLYSFAIQRYIRGSRENALKEISKNYLAAVLAETEEQCIGRLLGTPQAGIQRALQAADLAALQAEHDRLLGGPNQPGSIPSRFNFSYGSGGNARQTPLDLPEPPQQRAVAEETQSGL